MWSFINVGVTHGYFFPFATLFSSVSITTDVRIAAQIILRIRSNERIEVSSGRSRCLMSQCCGLTARRRDLAGGVVTSSIGEASLFVSYDITKEQRQKKSMFLPPCAGRWCKETTFLRSSVTMYEYQYKYLSVTGTALLVLVLVDQE